MDKLAWCKQQKNGIELISPNNNLCTAYLADADDSLLAMDKNSGKWKAVTAYYACYNAVYALLMKTGIKCEIHDCTLELMQVFAFSKEQRAFLEKLKKERIQVQYYLQAPAPLDTKQVKYFVVDCKKIAAELDAATITQLRGLVKNG